jgi:hypothetical protein
MIRYRRRRDTNGDLAPTPPPAETAGHHHYDEFWSGTGLIDGSSGNCNAVQDDRGFRDRTTVDLTAS